MSRASIAVVAAGAFAVAALVSAASLEVAAPAEGSAGRIAGLRSRPPRTLLTAPGMISSFAQDGKYVAWSGPGGERFPGCAVRLRSIVGTLRREIGPEVVDAREEAEGCAEEGLKIGVAGQHVVWGGFQDCCQGASGAFATDRLRKPVRLDDLDERHLPTGAAGDGPTLVYATVTLELTDPCYDPNYPFVEGCYEIVRGGSVKRVVDGEAVAIPRVPPAAAIAVAAGRVAIVPAAVGKKTLGGGTPTRRDAGVQIRDADNGTLALRVTPRGVVRAVALSTRIVAILVESGTMRIAIFDSHSGRLRTSIPVPRSTAHELTAAGTSVVYRVGKTIYVVRDGERAMIAQARARPIGLSLEGRRLAWAENVGGRGYVRLLELPTA